MKNRKWLSVIVGVITGAIAGYLYWQFVGYDERSPLISTVMESIFYGSFLGGLLTGILNSSRQLDTQC